MLTALEFINVEQLHKKNSALLSFHLSSATSDHILNRIGIKVGVFVISFVISQNGGKGYKNKGAFGVDAHKRLENMVKAWEKSNPHLKIGIKVTPETYVSKGGAKGVKAGRFPAGSVSIDIDISYKGETVLGIDLKTGKGWGKKDIENRMSRYRTKNLVQIFFEVK